LFCTTATKKGVRDGGQNQSSIATLQVATVALGKQFAKECVVLFLDEGKAWSETRP
jgi:hypothetical protein